MAAAFPFAVPSAIPQDLQLIQDIVGDIPIPSKGKAIQEHIHSDHEHGTDSDADSEQEVEADILGAIEDADGYVAGAPLAPPISSTYVQSFGVYKRFRFVDRLGLRFGL